MLSGPSSSGKTTTALLLRDSLRAKGLDAHVVSLDNFYRGRFCAPRLENGEYDYEALEALNLEQLHPLYEGAAAGRLCAAAAL